MKTIKLLHPIHDVPAVADVVDKLFDNGRYTGYILQFPDGHRTQMTFAEIYIAQDGLEEEAMI